jgi:hypothetical protein
MTMATRVAGKQWQWQRRGQGIEGGGQATGMMTKRASATAIRVAGNKGNGDGGKSNGDGNKGGRQATATRAMAMAMRVASKPWQ